MIEKLTKEQEALCPVYVKKWVEIGFSTEQASDEEMINAMKKVYQCGGVNPPEKIFVVDSPFECLVGAYIYKNNLKFKNLKSKIEAIKEQIKKKKLSLDLIKKESSNFVYGQHEASWLAFYDFFRMFNIPGLEKLDGLNEMAKYCNWGLCYDTVCFVSRKPESIKRNIRGQLHCENGPALRYKDGFAIWRLNGITIPKKWILTPPEEMDPIEILKEENVEVREELIKKIGMNNFYEKTGAKEIDTWDIVIEDKHLHYSLIMLNLGTEIGEIPYLKMESPSLAGVYHIEPVAKHIRTAKEAFEFRVRRKTLPFSAN